MTSSRLVSLSQKIIKPSSPTPLSHKIHKLCLIDQMETCFKIPMVLFYPKQDTKSSLEPTKVSHILEKSLSKVLTSYYPFAGQVRDNSFVECNDVGVNLFEVRIDCPMSRIFNHRRTYIDNLVYPKGIPWSSSIDFLVEAQLSHFECGGIALSACISHKVVDGASMANFLRDWAMIARDPEAKPSLLLNGASILQPINHSSPPVADIPIKQNTSERYHFSASKVEALKALISADSRSQVLPTTVEAVTAFLCKCINTPTFKPSLFRHAVNLRGKNNDALVPADLVGNFSLPFLVSATNEEELNLQRLVSELRKGKNKIRDTFKYIKSNELELPSSRAYDITNEINKGYSSNDFSRYLFTSLKNFPLNDIDFGWGRPTRVDLATAPADSIAFLNNLRNDGVEVLVNLEHEEMSAFRSNDELLQFASPSSGL